MILAVLAVAHAVTWDGGDYGGASIVARHRDVLAGTFTGVGRLEVAAGAVVYVPIGVPLVVTAEQVVIAGILTATGSGHPGGHGERFTAAGDGPGGGEGGGSDIAGGGGGGHGGGGGDGARAICEVPAGGHPGGPAAGDPDGFGSGGGATCGNGGSGGGAIRLSATRSLSVPGAVHADGDQGWSQCDAYGGGGSGGGAGGTVVLDAPEVRVDGVVTAQGGDGADGDAGYCSENGGGGGGGGGTIEVHGALEGTIAPDAVRGGAGGRSTGGAPDGDDGDAGTITLGAPATVQPSTTSPVRQVDPEGCGCSSGPAEAPLGVILLAALRRRRATL